MDLMSQIRALEGPVIDRKRLRGLMTSLRDSLVARMFQQLCRAPHLTFDDTIFGDGWIGC